MQFGLFCVIWSDTQGRGKRYFAFSYQIFLKLDNKGMGRCTENWWPAYYLLSILKMMLSFPVWLTFLTGRGFIGSRYACKSDWVNFLWGKACFLPRQMFRKHLLELWDVFPTLITWYGWSRNSVEDLIKEQLLEYIAFGFPLRYSLSNYLI